MDIDSDHVWWGLGVVTGVIALAQFIKRVVLTGADNRAMHLKIIELQTESTRQLEQVAHVLSSMQHDAQVTGDHINELHGKIDKKIVLEGRHGEMLAHISASVEALMKK